MARRRKGFLDDLVEVTARLPWWGGVLLAVVAYVALHPIATMEVPKPSGLGVIGDVVGKQLFKMLGTIGQYVLPFAFLIGSVVSAVQGRKRAAIYGRAAERPESDTLRGMSWREFELLISESFRRRGYQVLEKGGGRPDGGVDLVVTKNNERYLVQCKHWRAVKVGVNVVRELYGVVVAEGAVGGFAITSGAFTKDAMEFAAGRNIELIDGPRLLAMIGDAGRAAPVPGPQSPAKEATGTAAVQRDAAAGQPKCPRCQSIMIERTARQGASAGKKFWGCTRFPACKGTRPID